MTFDHSRFQVQILPFRRWDILCKQYRLSCRTLQQYFSLAPAVYPTAPQVLESKNLRKGPKLMIASRNAGFGASHVKISPFLFINLYRFYATINDINYSLY